MMVDSIGASTSVIGHRLPQQRRICFRDASRKPPRFVRCRLFSKQFMGQRLIRPSTTPGAVTMQIFDGSMASTIKSLATELTKEAQPSPKDRKMPPGFDYDTDVGLSPSRLWPPSNKADNPKLHNPLLRQERMGCGWLGVIFEWEGVIVEDDPSLEKQAWLVLAQEEGKSPPPAFVLKRIEGMKNEQAISEVLCWSRDRLELQRLAARKEELYQTLQGGGFYQIRSGSQEFMNTLVNHKIPIAVASTRPRKNLQEAIEAVGVQSFLNVIVAAEDVYRGKPDPEMFLCAAQLLNFIPERCIVFGNSNAAVEAAHDACMKCVAVASKHLVYELGAADLVVRRLDELSVVDLKNLADIDSPEFDLGEPEVEMEEEKENPSRFSSVGVDDFFW